MIQSNNGSIKSLISVYFNLNPDNKDDKDIIHRIYSYIGKGVEWVNNETNETFYLQGLANFGSCYVIIYNKTRNYSLKDPNNFTMEWKDFNNKFTPKELSWLDENWMTKKCDKY